MTEAMTHTCTVQLLQLKMYTLCLASVWSMTKLRLPV